MAKAEGRKDDGRVMEARYSRPHNAGMAILAVSMAVAAAAVFSRDGAGPRTVLPNDPRSVLFFMLVLTMGFYSFIGLKRFRDRTPQVVIDAKGIALGFGRNRRIAWDDIQWVRLRRLGFRPHVQIGMEPRAFFAAELKLSMWSFDDALRPVRGTPAAFLVRDNGLDTSATTMLDAVRAFRPNLLKP